MCTIIFSRKTSDKKPVNMTNSQISNANKKLKETQNKKHFENICIVSVLLFLTKKTKLFPYKDKEVWRSIKHIWQEACYVALPLALKTKLCVPHDAYQEERWILFGKWWFLLDKNMALNSKLMDFNRKCMTLKERN